MRPAQWDKSPEYTIRRTAANLKSGPGDLTAPGW
jgi:hypothetical protein